MTRWLQSLVDFLEQGEACMLVSVVAKTGSSPRGTDARMVVTGRGVKGTIGGGELEHRALAEARRLLRAGAAGKRQTALLGPDLGQCCGGAVELMFERFGREDIADLRDAVAQLGAGRTLRRSVRLSDDGSVERSFETVVSQLRRDPVSREVGGGAGDVFEELIEDNRQPLWVFGAGHVGRSVVGAMAGLPFAVTWIDSREEMFTIAVPAGVEVMVPEEPARAVTEAPAGAWYLVMTHSHGLDEAICEQVLRRADAVYLGLIGSNTKRARFEHRLGSRGIDRAAIAAMHCPIGLNGIAGKAPAVIAASVAADLLMRLERAENDRQTTDLGLKDEAGQTRSYAQGH